MSKESCSWDSLSVVCLSIVCLRDLQQTGFFHNTHARANQVTSSRTHWHCANALQNVCEVLRERGVQQDVPETTLALACRGNWVPVLYIGARSRPWSLFHARDAYVAS